MDSGRRRWTILPGQGDQPRLFEECLLPHLDTLYGLARRLTRDDDDAADLLQDTALRAFEKFHQLRHRGAVRAWLIKILTSIFLNRFAGDMDDERRAVATEPVVSETPEVALLRRCDADTVEAALAELPAAFRLTVLLADVEEIPLREIALLCACPVGTVASRLARGRALLRVRLGHLRRAGAEEV